MLFIFLNLRYFRQLNKTNPIFLSDFFTSLKNTAKRTGAIEYQVLNGFLCSFEKDSPGTLYASSEFIFDLQRILDANKQDIYNYFAIVELCENFQSIDLMIETITERYNDNIPLDDAIYISPQVKDKIEPYCRLESVSSFSLYKYLGSVFNKPSVKIESSSFEKIIFFDTFKNPLVSLIDFAQIYFKFPIIQDTEQSSEDIKVLSMYLKYRFDIEQADYRTKICIEYLIAQFKTYVNTSGKPLNFLYFGSLDRDFANLFSSVCTFTKSPALKFNTNEHSKAPNDFLELVYLVYKASFYFLSSELPYFFEFLGKSQDFYTVFLQRLYSEGFLSNPEDARTIDPQFLIKYEKRISNRISFLNACIANFMWDLYEKGHLLPDVHIFGSFVELGKKIPDEFVLECLCARDSIDCFDQVLKTLHEPLLVAGFKSFIQAKDFFNEQRMLEAQEYAKKALLIFQKFNTPYAEYLVFSFIALYSFVQNKRNDTIAYAEYAVEKTQFFNIPNRKIQARVDLSIYLFLNGNYASALQNLEIAEKLVLKYSVKDKEIFLFFLRGRIFFEIGDYQNAEIYFQAAASEASIHQFFEAVSLCRVWYARTQVYQGKNSNAEEILEACISTVPESKIYLLESYYVSGKQLDNEEYLFNSNLENVPLFSLNSLLNHVENHILGNNSFQFLEDRGSFQIGENSVQFRYFSLFYLALQVTSAEEDKKESILLEMIELSKKAQEQNDPYTYLYYFLCFEAQKNIRVTTQTINSLYLSKAFKLLQVRAKELGDNLMREFFMQKSLFNSKLYKEAQEYKLI